MARYARERAMHENGTALAAGVGDVVDMPCRHASRQHMPTHASSASHEDCHATAAASLCRHAYAKSFAHAVAATLSSRAARLPHLARRA